ncbi:hypothetical protein [Reyranella sp.]|uniref:hypothetical protein n=1 Tax=Reyranella sp. TaxID=1929291 RepID=UPI003D0C7460
MSIRLTDDERTGLLWALYDALLKHLHAALTSGGPVKASMLDVARRFLASQGIHATTRGEAARSLDALSKLPFDRQ